MKSLLELYINHNEIASLTKISQIAPNLEVLDISHNKIIQIEEIQELRELRKLAELFIVGNTISPSKG